MHTRHMTTTQNLITPTITTADIRAAIAAGLATVEGFTPVEGTRLVDVRIAVDGSYSIRRLNRSTARSLGLAA
jgi:hypothetical protein